MSEWRLTRLRGEFCVTWQGADGVRRRYRLGTTDPKEASRLATSRYADLTRPKGTKVKDIWASYCHAKQGIAVLETMKHTWKALSPRFAEMEAIAIKVDDCRAHTAERRAAKISDGTIHTELGHLRMTLKWAENNGVIVRAPYIERPTKPEPRDYYITREEAKRLMAAAKVPHIALAVRLMIATGARVTAALELTWDRVDFDRKMINLRNPFDTSRRKGRASIPMNEMLELELRLAKASALSPFVIEWAGVPVKSIKKGLKAAAIASNLPDVTPHVLRHSAAVWLVEDGHPMSEVAQFLGHSNTRMTEKVYGRYSPDHLRTLASSLSF